MTILAAGSATHVGQVRSNNQDSYLEATQLALFAVADGMGGHAGGEIASQMAVELLEEHAGDPSLDNLQHAVRVANRAIFERAGAQPELHGMGTTMCAVWVVPSTDTDGDEIAWINVGDSRVYLLRDSSLIQLSRDHSLVEDLKRDGQLTEEEAAVHPKRNIITRALGIDVDVDVDGSSVLPFNGDRFVLCSDGLFGEASEEQISSVLRRLADPKEAAEELVRIANEAGGRDNITVVVVDVVDDGGRSLKAAEVLAAEQARLDSRNGEPETKSVDATDHDPFAGRRSSLPESDRNYGADIDDPFAGIDKAASKRVTWRVIAFLLALLAVLAAVFGATAVSANGTYFVGFEGEEVAVYKGKPGGVLWINPSLVESGPLTRKELPEDARVAVQQKPQFSSKGKAMRYVATLQERVDELEDKTTSTTTTAPGSTSTSTTSANATSTTTPVITTVPAAPTTAAPKAPTTTKPAG